MENDFSIMLNNINIGFLSQYVKIYEELAHINSIKVLLSNEE